jgi:hypothetical protein
MTMHLSNLAPQIIDRFPLATVELDEPANEGGAEYLDIRLADRLVVVEWCQSRGCSSAAARGLEQPRILSTAEASYCS